MAATPISNEHLHCVFVYCNKHDQGAVAIITHTEWLDITTTTSTPEANYGNENCYDYEKIFNYVITMCGINPPECKWSWCVCGELEYNPQGDLLIGQESVKTNFDRECGGWKFKYFKHELFTSKEHIGCYALPSIVIKYLSHHDVPEIKD